MFPRVIFNGKLFSFRVVRTNAVIFYFKVDVSNPHTACAVQPKLEQLNKNFII